MKKIIHTYVQKITFSVPEDQKTLIFQKLNKFHFGKKIILLNVEQEKIPKALIEAHNNVHAFRILYLEVTVYSDGSTSEKILDK
jgi:hypothetical protein